MPKLFDLLDKDQIKEKLVAVVEAKLADEIIEKFWRLDAFNSLISYPQFLDVLIAYLSETKLTGAFKKYGFYKYLLGKVSGNGEFLKKLTQLALVIELHQVNEFNPAEFKKILDGLEIDESTLYQTGLIEKSKKEEKDVIGFCHHTISEFLVADFLSNQENFIAKLEEFVLVKDNGSILAVAFSWYGVIRCLLDGDKGSVVRQWLFGLVKDNDALADDGFCDAITSVDPNELSLEEGQQIFSLIYDTYQEKKVWPSIWTRARLFEFCQEDDYNKRLKVDVQNGSGTETEVLVRRGIVVDIVARLMEAKSPLIAGGEKAWWREILVKLANDNNDNGVVQRRALAALATYHDVKLVSEVGSCLNHRDNLVREAYVEFCYETDPNDETVIGVLVKGIVDERTDIYSRHGFYQITKKEGIRALLKYLVDNQDFLKKFLDKESIFNSKDKNSDEVIIEKIEEFVDEKIIGQIRQIIKNSFERNDIHDQERSYFLKQLARIVEKKYPKYIFEIIGEIQANSGDKERLAYDYIPLFSWLVTVGNVVEFHKQLSDICKQHKGFADQVIYGTRHRDEAIYQAAVAKGIVTKIEDLESDRQGYNRDGEIIKEFRRLLGTETDKKYFPGVFEYFVQNQRLIEQGWTDNEKERLAKLTIGEGLEKIEPRKIVVKIQKNEGGRANQYTISTAASYFGHVIRVARILGLDLKKYKQKIINFIPFAYSDDRQTIREVIDQIEDKDLTWVNQVYLDKANDIRYFLPDSYIYLIRDYHEKGYRVDSAKEILLSFATDNGLSNQDRRYAIETLGKLVTVSDSEIKDELKNDLGSDEVNRAAIDVLIGVFKDELAIRERIKQIKEWSKEAEKYKPLDAGVENWRSPTDIEVDEMYLAQPLMKIGDDRYKAEFMDLLDYSVEILGDENKKEVLWAYVDYLWKIVVGYFSGLENKDFRIIRELEDWLDRNKGVDRINWFEGRLNTLRRIYIEQNSRKTIDGAIRIAGGSDD